VSCSSETSKAHTKRPSTTETLKIIRQKHDESRWDYVKHFYNAKNAILYIQITNAFRNGVSDIKTVEEIAMKKPKTVVDLLAVTDTCIEASEARARLLEYHGKGTSKKKQDNREINTIDRGDYKDRRDNGFCGKRSSDQKEKRPFHRPDDAEKWGEIHRTSGLHLEECNTFMDRKKMPPPAAPVPQDAHRGEHLGQIPLITMSKWGRSI
jgi:hypothetical protein